MPEPPHPGITPSGRDRGSSVEQLPTQVWNVLIFPPQNTLPLQVIEVGLELPQKMPPLQVEEVGVGPPSQKIPQVV
jgi:hypothetical protein